MIELKEKSVLRQRKKDLILWWIARYQFIIVIKFIHLQTEFIFKF